MKESYNMTKREFVEVLRGIIKNDLYIQNVDLQKAAKTAAEHCFIKKVPESENTEKLRHQLNNLYEKGYFLFSE